MSQDYFKSLFNPNKDVKVNQYICELVCINRCKNLKCPMPKSLWSDSSWSSYYKFQLKKCNELLAHYSAEVILQVVTDKSIYNLNTYWIESALQQARKKVLPPKQTTESLVIEETKIVKKSTGRQNSSNNLDFLD